MPSPSPRVQAFLDTLGHFESKGRYDVMTGGDRFTDMSQHPNSKNKDGNCLFNFAKNGKCLRISTLGGYVIGKFPKNLHMVGGMLSAGIRLPRFP